MNWDVNLARVFAIVGAWWFASCAYSTIAYPWR